jgi:hypothetical protein
VINGKVILIFLAAVFGTLSLVRPAGGQHLSARRESGFAYAFPDTALDSRGEHLDRFRLMVGRQPASASLLLRRTEGYMQPGGSNSLSDLKLGGRRISYRRAGLLCTANAGVVIFGFRQAIVAWGKSKGGFHFKDDWNGDRLAQIDELSHFMWGYKMTQFLFCSYQWAGFSSRVSRVISISQTALVLTIVEYPVDAYNPKQGFGISDLMFDYAGIGLACLKQRCHWLENFDFKISPKKSVLVGNQPVFAQTYEQFDNFIYWFTYRTRLFLPRKALCLGVGYGVTHRQDEPRRHFLLGVGLSLPDFISLFGEDLGKRARFLEVLYPHLHLEL